MLASAVWVACLHGWRASVGGVGGVLAWVAWMGCLHGWLARMDDVPVRVMWVVCIYVCFISISRIIALYRYVV